MFKELQVQKVAIESHNIHCIQKINKILRTKKAFLVLLISVLCQSKIVNIPHNAKMYSLCLIRNGLTNGLSRLPQTKPWCSMFKRPNQKLAFVEPSEIKKYNNIEYTYNFLAFLFCATINEQPLISLTIILQRREHTLTLQWQSVSWICCLSGCTLLTWYHVAVIIQ